VVTVTNDVPDQDGQQPPRIHTLPDSSPSWAGQSQAGRPPVPGDQPTAAQPDAAQPYGGQPYGVPGEHQAAWSSAQTYYGQGYQPDPRYAPPAGYPATYQPGYPPPGYQPGYPPPGQYPPHGYWAPPPLGPKKHGHRALYAMVAAGVVTALAVGGVALAVDHANNSSQQTSLTSPTQTNPFGQGGSSGNGFGFGGNSGGSGGTGSSGSGTSTGQATSAQSVGVVDINTTLEFGSGKAAGTGIVLTSDGEILTNNHVVQDSTAISVTVVSTGKTYTATVVGTDKTDDVAVIKLQNASGLATAKLGDSSQLNVGDPVTAVGNAGGVGGTPSAASGSITALNRSITASDQDGSNAEQLTGLIEVDAGIQAGDSGGPLYATSSGTVIGMDTAASSSGSRFGTTTSGTGYAIPIAKATSIAQQIVSGKASSTIRIGLPAFFGVQLSPASQQLSTGGAPLSGVVPGSGAAKAGLAAGDTITAVDGTAIASPTALSAQTAKHHPGDRVSVTYTDASGQSHTVTVTLGEGPAD
jgi:S1-C subfamily serine protease